MEKAPCTIEIISTVIRGYEVNDHALVTNFACTLEEVIEIATNHNPLIQASRNTSWIQSNV
jgi:hypothetical protein